MNADLLVRCALIAVSTLLALAAGAGAGLVMSGNAGRPRESVNRNDVVLLAGGLAVMAACTVWSNVSRLHQPVRPPAIGFLAGLTAAAIAVARVVYRMTRQR